uniref:Uncharacterized protein n=1 Tax=Populus davidiana TaxID=266767 RepID=A0A6M2EIJ8_9ROSI
MGVWLAEGRLVEGEAAGESFNGFGREPAEGSLIFAFISKARDGSREGEMAQGRRSWLLVSGQKRRKLALGENGYGGGYVQSFFLWAEGKGEKREKCWTTVEKSVKEREGAPVES